MNEKYSFKDFTGQSLTNVRATQLNNTVIKGSNFYQEDNPGINIFPVGMTGVTFDRCNLDNVSVPPGNTVLPNCSNRRIKPQNDLEDWIVNNSDQPVEPLNKKTFQDLGLSIDPRDIPNSRKKTRLTEEKERELGLTSVPIRRGR